MKLEKGTIRKFDVKTVEENLTRENQYITHLWNRMPNFTRNFDRAYDGTVKKLKPVRGHESRAKTIEELYRRLDEIKGKRLNYQEKIAKKIQKNKAAKKCRKAERRRNKTFVKGEKQIPDKNIPTSPEVKPKPSKPAKPVLNNEGKIVFSKFDFAETIGSDTRKKETKDPHKLLKKIEKQKERLKHIEETEGKEKVIEIQQKLAWKAAFQKTQGIKVKDDPVLLQKTLKKRIQKKKKSRKEWQRREEIVQKQMEERQQKRKANIEAKTKQKKMKKVKQMVKRGRLIPGVNISK